MNDMMTTVQGDGGLPDKGTGTAVEATYGADVGADATNRTMGIAGMTGSDAMDEDEGIDQKWGNLGAGTPEPSAGTSITGMTKSDAIKWA